MSDSSTNYLDKNAQKSQYYGICYGSINEEKLEEDGRTISITLKILPSSLVILQAIIENYDGLATVRTVEVGSKDENVNIVAIYVDASQADLCRQVLKFLVSTV
jgi:hypothetical protein